jgi:hypothetical protein
LVQPLHRSLHNYSKPSGVTPEQFIDT